MEIREAYFAKQGWYPAEEQACRLAIDEYFSKAEVAPGPAMAGIVPHAGWFYSGQVAAHTFLALKANQPEVVFLFGGHLSQGSSCNCMTTGAFQTPLGPILVDVELATKLAKAFGCPITTKASHSPDNTIELQLPFIKALWPQARIVAVQVPPGQTAMSLGEWVAHTARTDGIPIVAIGSTDLTHYGTNYGFTPKGLGPEALHWSKTQNDRPFLDLLCNLDAEAAMQHAQQYGSACCPGAAGGLVSFAKAVGIELGRLLVHTTSHEVEDQGKPHMWVGYGSVVF